MDAKKLISKIEVVYDLLQKLPLDLDFYEKYHEYKLLAIEIENLTKIDKKTSPDNKGNSFDSFMTNSLYGYVHFKLLPLLNFIEEKKDIFFIEFPDENLFKEIKYNFIKLGKMEGDERYDYWLAKTENNFNDFLNNLKTTKNGNDFFIKTNIMNAITEIDSLYKHRKKDKKIKKSFIERIDDNDTYGLVKQIKGLEPDKKPNFTISLKDKGETDYISFYDRNNLTKEEILEPVNLFQGLISANFKNGEQIFDKENIVYFNYETSKIICNGKEIKMMKGKNIYYTIKYLFEREDIYEECFYDEIRDDSELKDCEEITDKNIYDALVQFNKRLIIKGLNDLFVINFHSIKIRNKYKIVTL